MTDKLSIWFRCLGITVSMILILTVSIIGKPDKACDRRLFTLYGYCGVAISKTPEKVYQAQNGHDRHLINPRQSPESK